MTKATPKHKMVLILNKKRKQKEENKHPFFIGIKYRRDRQRAFDI